MPAYATVASLPPIVKVTGDGSETGAARALPFSGAKSSTKDLDRFAGRGRSEVTSGANPGGPIEVPLACVAAAYCPATRKKAG